MGEERITRCPSCVHTLKPELGLGPCKYEATINNKRMPVCGCKHVSHFTNQVVRVEY